MQPRVQTILQAETIDRIITISITKMPLLVPHRDRMDASKRSALSSKRTEKFSVRWKQIAWQTRRIKRSERFKQIPKYASTISGLVSRILVDLQVLFFCSFLQYIAPNKLLTYFLCSWFRVFCILCKIPVNRQTCFHVLEILYPS